MKMNEVRDLSPDELEGKEKELRTELFNLKFRKATGQLDNTARIRLVRRDLARVISSRRERSAETAEASGGEN
jgi:large subunit ribosomal protein L29